MKLNVRKMQQGGLTPASSLGLLQPAAAVQGCSWLFLNGVRNYTPGLPSDLKMQSMDSAMDFRNRPVTNSLQRVAQPAVAVVRSTKQLICASTTFMADWISEGCFRGGFLRLQHTLTSWMGQRAKLSC
jgi:hypothetical protein